jgi:superfamily II DNA or RNA helicase
MIDVTIGATLQIRGLSEDQIGDLHEQFDFSHSRRAWVMGAMQWESATYPVVWESETEEGCVTLPYGCLLEVAQRFPGGRYARETASFPRASFPPLILDREDRDGQREALAAVEAYLTRKHYGFCVIAPCGAGKSWLGCRLIALFAQPTCIIVHTQELLHQWQELIRAAFGIEPAIIADGKGEPGPSITIALVQTLVRLAPGMADAWGCLIFDECHHVPAVTFAEVANTLRATVKIGLSASKQRGDGLHPLLYATLGPIVAEITQQAMVQDGVVLAPEVQVLRTGYHWPGKKPKENFTKLMGALVADQARNQLLADAIALHAMNGRRVLVLSARVEHLRLLAEELSWYPLAVQLLHGTLKPAERTAAMARLTAGFPITLAIDKLGKEGLDAPVLDTLCFATPARDAVLVQQCVGRIQRVAPGKPRPLVMDCRDDAYATAAEAKEEKRECSERLLYWQWMARARVYRRLGAVINE